MVDSIRGNKGLQPLDPLKKTGKVDSSKSKDQSGKADFASELKQASQAATTAQAGSARQSAGSTPVQFSPMMQHLGKVSDEMDVERTAKLQELKQQIAEGNYQPDLKKVAASLLYFVAKGK